MCRLFLSLSVLIHCGCGGMEAVRLRILNPHLSIEMQKTHAHPFLAEYDFKLVLKTEGREIDAINMTGDTGGLTRIDVSQVNPTLIAFRDHARTVCLNIEKRELAGCSPETNGRDLGRFDFDKSRTWLFMPSDGGY